MGFFEAAFFNFDSAFYIITPVFFVITTLMWVIAWAKVRRYSANKGNLLITTILLLPFISENIFFVVAAVSQPSYDFGFWLTEFSSVVIFYLSIIIYVVCLIVGFIRGFVNYKTFYSFTKLSLLSIPFQISIILAFGTPSMVLITAFYVINAIIRIILGYTRKYTPQSRKSKKD